MKRSLKLFSLFSSLIIILLGCSMPSGFHQEKWTTSESFRPVSVLSEGYKTILYKMRIELDEQFFSGLLFFKRFVNGSYRIVFLSEFGLNLLDLEYRKDKIKVINHQDFFNNKTLIQILAEDVKLLIKKIEKTENPRFYINENSRLKAMRFEDEWGEYTYFYNSDNKLVEIKQKTGIFRGVQVLIDGYQEGFPPKILFEHPWSNLRVRLNLLQVKS